MGRVSGFTCDNPNCDTFVAAPETVNMPIGWVSIIPQANTSDSPQKLVVCSNKCLVEISLARYEAEHEAPYMRVNSRGRAFANGADMMFCDDETLASFGIAGVKTCGKPYKGALGLSLHLTKKHNVAGGLGIATDKEKIDV